MTPIDLRSDTVTRPTEAMREAMARAEVGDDVFGEDPTLNRLEEEVARRFGHEAALFVPSGTMANQIALLTWCRPGDDVIVPTHGHMYAYETGAASALAGVMLTVLPDALYTADAVHAHVKPDNHRSAPTRLVVVENTHNHSGGRVWPLEQLREVAAACRDHDLPLHMDGARLFNAAVASGTSLSDYGQAVDALSVCLSKGLGCPVGSLLIGSRDWIWRAHRFRKMLGGGMRQAGLLAAAGLHALDHHVERLAEDHARARRFAEFIADLDGIGVDLDSVETNMVFFELHHMDGATFQAEAEQRGLRCLALGARVRVVFHLDVDDADTERACTIVQQIVGGG